MKNTISRLKGHGIKFEAGLTSEEIIRIEDIYKIIFPVDLREMLHNALPVGERFPNWRDFSEHNTNRILEMLNWPLEGMLFDVEHNEFWFDLWGSKPIEIEKAKELCIEEYKKVPKLIPIYSHRYISSHPNEEGNPIFSVYQTDIIYYGENLDEYFKVEFNDKEHKDINYSKIKKIEFWSDIVG
ncbi:SMI1/KNR4 family protein [Paenibacillus sp. SC116]|uniref:SMI1/KNR4 family protein n=1 Tax=Paenibacillus sp. SC116 TaxID=2968986 RepID=UPI00215A5553|nr:SMI1/KNR4 family protein [Paenibacillus sp. SC116]MCR8843327.1 SMI1/KNR4 family protein [Paenibacillus sp. SC116]